MTATTVHATFTLERAYPVAPARVFAAWADPAAKARWFAPDGGADHRLDFRVGGVEAVSARHGGATITFESLYRDIVEGERIVYTSVLATDGRVDTLSLTTVTISPADAAGAGTRLVLVEQGAYLDGAEQPAWREQGTSDQLDALGRTLG